MNPKSEFPRDRKMLMADIREGYGVEDIAVRNDLAIGRVRGEVRWLRRFGYLDNMFPGWKASRFGRWHGEKTTKAPIS